MWGKERERKKDGDRRGSNKREREKKKVSRENK